MRKLFAFIFVLLFASAVFAQTFDEANNAIAAAENNIQDMIKANFSVAYVTDTLQVAKDSLSAGKYDICIQKTDLIAARKKAAFDISDALTSIQTRIDDDRAKGISVSTVQGIYDQALTEFQDENYDRANIYITQTYTELNNAEAYTSLVMARVTGLRDNIFYFISDNWKGICVVILVIIAAGFVLYKRYYRIYLKKKIENYIERKRMINTLIKRAQEERYKKKTLSVDAYKLKVDKYKEKESELEDTINILRSKLRKFR